MTTARHRPLAAAVALLALSMLAGCGTTSGSADGSSRYVAGDGSTTVLAVADREAAPTVSGTTLEGSPLDLADLRGKVVVVNMWASWCGPCRGEAGTLEKVYAETKAKGVEFVGIVSGSKDSVDNAKAFTRRFEVSYPSMFDQDNTLLLAFRGLLPPAAIPTTLVLDREGRVAARALGPVDYSRLLGMIEPVLREAS